MLMMVAIDHAHTYLEVINKQSQNYTTPMKTKLIKHIINLAENKTILKHQDLTMLCFQ